MLYYQNKKNTVQMNKKKKKKKKKKKREREKCNVCWKNKQTYIRWPF